MKKVTANNQFDVIIIGAGPAGTAAAISLSQLGYKAALIERSDYDKIRFGETVQPEIKKLLNQLGVWEKFVEDKHFPASGIQSAWGQNELYENNYIFNPYGNGWHLDRLKFDTMMVNAAENKDVWVLRGVRVEECIDDAHGHWTINCRKQDQVHKLHAKFVVDASGRASFIARKKNIRRISYDKLIGIAAFFPSGTNSISKGFFLIEAAENGWWYSAELPGLKTAIVYMTDVDLYPNSSMLPAFFWRQQLDKTIYTKQRADPNAMIGLPHILSVFSSHLESFGGANWLAVGDAAISFDPLASQGICKALDSGINAAEAIHNKSISNRPIPESFYINIAEDFGKYLSSRSFYYRKEQRWRESVFWQRRHVDMDIHIRKKLVTET